VAVVDELARLGGVTTRSALVAACSRVEVDRALSGGSVVALGHGRYALPTVDRAVGHAHALSGVLSVTSAALRHGWAVKTVPERPHVTVPRHRKVSPKRRAAVHLHYQDLAEDDVDGVMTGKVVTLRDCLRMLPFDEALTVADSALREGDGWALHRAVTGVHGPGRAQAQRVGRLADGKADNPFESVLRAIACDVPGLHVTPQVWIKSTVPACRPDLVDRALRIVLEADSFTWHGKRKELVRDARRYNRLIANGWLVLRFSWEDVMFAPDDVRKVLIDTVAVAARLAEDRRCRCGAA
jgi:very-short-patch-repair endonuclease